MDSTLPSYERGGIGLLEEKQGKFKFSEEEQDVIVVGETLSEEDKIKERHSLLGRIFIDRAVSKETITGMTKKIWRLSKPPVFIEVGMNRFIVTFATETYKQRVISGWPELFDNHLFALQNMDGTRQLSEIAITIECFWVQIHNLPFHCMNRYYGSIIGEQLGRVMDIDIDDDDIG